MTTMFKSITNSLFLNDTYMYITQSALTLFPSIISKLRTYNDNSVSVHGYVISS